MITMTYAKLHLHNHEWKGNSRVIEHDALLTI
jgi:hypothetical protein